MKNDKEYKVLGHIEVHSEYSAKELDAEFWYGERQKVMVPGVEGAMTQAQKNKSSALNNPNSVKKIAFKVLETRKLSKSPIAEIAALANELLDKWDIELDGTIQAVQVLSEKIQQLIPESESIQLIPNVESKKYPITWDDTRIWKMLKIIVLIDKGVTVVEQALRLEPEKRKKILTANKRLLKPLRKVFNDIAREHNELKKLKENLESKEVVTN